MLQLQQAQERGRVEQKRRITAPDARADAMSDHVAQVRTERVDEEVNQIDPPALRREPAAKLMQQLAEGSDLAVFAAVRLVSDRQTGLAREVREQRYALAVELAEEERTNVDLYAEVQQQVQPRARARLRI